MQGANLNLSPRRQRHADRLLGVLHWHGGKVWLDDQRYAELAEQGMSQMATDLAVDDLFAARLVKVSLAGDVQVLRLRRPGDDDDEDGGVLASAKAPIMPIAPAAKAKPKIVMAAGRRGRP